ncbi:hypothetical protein AURDEDRAFT_180120 [Auricularia subglabra TFB-10046 SS5]|nr:hypothetical protein AURDEDRAFT_180120 [Auricularia subglabra TFB-10046 SS5]
MCVNSRQLLAAASCIRRTPAFARVPALSRSYAAPRNAAGNLLKASTPAASTAPLAKPSATGKNATVPAATANARPTFSPGKFYFASQFVRNKAPPITTLHTKYRRLGPGSRESHAEDPFVQLRIDPLREFQNVTLLHTFMTRMGKIQPRHETGLSWRSQRKMGQAIRRAKAMCIIPQQSRVVPRARHKHN